MWLSIPQADEKTFDLLLGLSPEVYFGPEGSALVHMGVVASYWKMGTLKISYEEENFEHPLLAKLLDLSRKHRLSFTFAPTAAIAFWLAKYSPASLINIWDYDRFLERVQSTSLHLGQDFVSDLLEQSKEAVAAFEHFRIDLEDLGITSLGMLLNLQQDNALNLRFGPPCAKLLKRLRMQSDFDLHEYVPALTLEQSFYPALEDHISSDKNPHIMERLREILLSWEERLRARQALLCGLHLYLRSSRKNMAVTISFRLPRPTRDPVILMKILEEKWHAEAGKQKFPDEIEIVRLSSLGLKQEQDRQLSLFDPRREEISEDWNLLLARLQTKSTAAHPIRIGTYQAFPSFWPETSVEWVDWKEDLKTEAIEDHPARPEVLLRVPQAIATIHSETDFFRYLENHEALSSLERLRDTWNGSFEERSYARVENQWVFWDHQKKKLFVHGYFENENLARVV